MGDNADLFAHSLNQPAPSGAEARGGTALVFDERMQLHAESRLRPHPERPDRIKAVVARLMASGLAGVCSGWVASTQCSDEAGLAELH